MASLASHRGSTSTDKPPDDPSPISLGAMSTGAVEEVAMNGDVPEAKPCYELHRAVFHGEETRVGELLAIKLNPNAPDKHGR